MPHIRSPPFGSVDSINIEDQRLFAGWLSWLLATPIDAMRCDAMRCAFVCV